MFTNRRTQFDEMVLQLVLLLSCIAEDGKLRANVREWESFCQSFLNEDATRRLAKEMWKKFYKSYLMKGTAVILTVTAASFVITASGMMMFTTASITTLLLGPAAAAGK